MARRMSRRLARRTAQDGAQGGAQDDAQDSAQDGAKDDAGWQGGRMEGWKDVRMAICQDGRKDGWKEGYKDGRLLLLTWTVAALAYGGAALTDDDNDDPTTKEFTTTTEAALLFLSNGTLETTTTEAGEFAATTGGYVLGKGKDVLDLEDYDGGDLMSGDDVEDAVDAGLKMMHELYAVKEPQLYHMGLFLDDNEPAARVAAFSAPNAQATLQARYGYAAVQAALRLREKYPETRSRRNPENVRLPRAKALADQCPLRGRPRCPPASRRYRTSDGTCNNLDHPWRGASMLPMQRFLMPAYEDGVQEPRRSVRGRRLPSAREVSIRIHRDRNVEMGSVTMMFMQWGQFLDHDVTSTAQARAFNNSVPRCCARGGGDFLAPEFTHPECMPIEVPPEDWFLERLQIRCIEFIRSAPATRINCDLGWREQINQVTAYIDASTVYGSDPDRADSLRIFRRGLLQYGRRDSTSPPDPPHGEICHMGALSSECFKGGDTRMGEQPGLTAFHTVWLRYHNHIARVLGDLNPHWSDEKIYQEGRRIVGALVQHITFKEFLPILLGYEVVDLFGLGLERKGYYDGYDSRVNPAPASGFSTAAFRFGHSLVQNSYVRTDEKHRPMFNNVSIHEEQSNPENIWSVGSLDRLLLGFSNQVSQRRDEFICRELTHHLFQSPGQTFGMDLAAVNIQRGRDHGIPSYTSWREPCGLTPVRRWSDLESLMSFETIQRFRSIYDHVDDIDLYPGGLAEKPVRGGIVGPTFACIIAQQFSNYRKGDRFWYENGGFESSFTPAQLQQLRRISFGKVLCTVLPEIETIQPFVFLTPDEFRNNRISCESADMDHLDLRAWEERRSSLVSDDNLVASSQKHKTSTHRPSVDNKLDFGTSHLSIFGGKKNSTSTKPREDLEDIKVDNKLDFSGGDAPSSTQKIKTDDFEVLFFTSNKGAADKKRPQKFSKRDFDWNDFFGVKKKVVKKRSVVDDYYDDDDRYVDKDEYIDDDLNFSRRKGGNKKKSKKRTTTRPTTTKRYQTRPLTSDFYNPIKVKLTNITTAPHETTDRIYGIRTSKAPNFYPSAQYDETYILHPTYSNKNKPKQHPNQNMGGYQVNINIQYLVPSTPKTDITVDKLHGRPNVQIIQNSYATSPYPYDEYSTTKRPVHIYPIRTTTKRPSNYFDRFGTTDGYFDHYSTTQRPTSYRPPFDSYKEEHDDGNPLFLAGRPSSNYDHDKFEDKPFSTSKRPYIYKPSESYLSMFDELHTTPTTTKKYAYLFGYADKDKQTYQYGKPSTINPTYYHSTAKRPTIPQYLYLYSYNKNVDSTDTTDTDETDTDSTNMDLTDADSTIHYVGNRGDKYEYHGDRDGNDGDKNFVKISSVQGKKYLHRSNKEHIINIAQQKEGELELFDGRVGDDVEVFGDSGDDEVEKLLVEIIPRENKNDDWLIFNETMDEKPTIEPPLLRSALDDNSTTPELPKPFTQFWNTHSKNSGIYELKDKKDEKQEKSR